MLRSIALLSALLLTACHCHDDCDATPRHHDQGERRFHDGPDEPARECVGLGDRADAASAPVDAATPRADGDRAGCLLDRDCAAAGAGLVCDARSASCVVPVQCSADAVCGAGERCLGGRCRPPSAVCQFATDCGAGRDCVDGRCLAGCGVGAACPATQACVRGYCDEPTTSGGACARATDCAAGSVCADGRCVAACDAARPCGAAEVCALGFCRVDTTPRRFCERDADCAAGSVCRRGSCRAACPGGTADECLRVDVGFDTCGADLLCTNPVELRPECARSADCPSSTVCVNARCR